MKIREVLTFIDQARPNAYTDGEKIHWLNIIEGMVYREIFQKAEGFDRELVPFEEGQEERELAVPAPFTELYHFFLMSRIDFFNGDSARYNDTMVLLENAWDEFAAWYRENNKPKQTNLHGMIPHRGW